MVCALEVRVSFVVGVGKGGIT